MFGRSSRTWAGDSKIDLDGIRHILGLDPSVLNGLTQSQCHTQPALTVDFGLTEETDGCIGFDECFGYMVKGGGGRLTFAKNDI